MNIEVLFFGDLRKLTDHRQVVSFKKGAQLTNLIEHLIEEYGHNFRQEINRSEWSRILINGKEHDLLGGMGAPLQDGDVVAFMPLTAGG